MIFLELLWVGLVLGGLVAGLGIYFSPPARWFQKARVPVRLREATPEMNVKWHIKDRYRRFDAIAVPDSFQTRAGRWPKEPNC